MKLFYFTGACSLSPHIALREAGLDFDLVKIDNATRTTPTGENYYAINPKGSVPALQMQNGEVLTEGPAIVQYIADLAPERNLAPKAGTPERYRLQEMLNYITSEVHKTYSPLFNPDMPAEAKTIFRTNLGKKFTYLNECLKNQDYLLGNTFTVADGYLYNVLRWASRVDVDLNQWPALNAFFNRINQRPGVQAALQAEGLN